MIIFQMESNVLYLLSVQLPASPLNCQQNCKQMMLLQQNFGSIKKESRQTAKTKLLLYLKLLHGNGIRAWRKANR